MARRRTFLAITLGVLFASGFAAPDARAQTPDELTVGRQLFADGLKDEEHQQFAAALEKYRRVQKIKDTVPVRYRIGSSLEGLAKLAQAVDAYTGAVRLGNETKTNADVVKAAQARIDALGPRIAHVTIAGARPDAEVAVDGEPIPADALSDVRVDPGSHVVTASAKNTKLFRAPVTVAEGARADVAIVLEPLEAPPPPPPPPPPEETTSSRKTLAIIVGAAGGALAIGGAVVLAIRTGTISDLKSACPGGNCPLSREDELQGKHDNAVTEGPIGIALVAVGLAAIGAGAVLYFTGGSTKSKSSTRLVPSPTTRGAMLTLASGF